MNNNLLTPKELARRWNLNHKTLANWRSELKGPAFMKIGTRVLYKIEDIEAFENKQTVKRY